jgi:predicted nucleic-acid-binding protein
VIGLDTNVLARYIMQDDAAQAAAATRLIESRCSADDPGMVSSVVLCELAWILERGYRVDRTALVRVFRAMLSAEELQVDEPEIAWRALRLFETGSADYADYLIGAVHAEHGASVTFTFDQAAAECDLLEQVPGEPEPEADGSSCI